MKSRPENELQPKKAKFKKQKRNPDPVVGSHSFEKIQETRRNLPIYSAKDRLQAEIRENPSLVIIGETGSGKTTQIPQFVFEEDPSRGIAITQPRRIAAISVATRVAEEMGEKVGEGRVGYHVRFERVASAKTKITFLTDGMLLREAMLDNSLSQYGTVILDEAHERSLHTDVLFAVLKDIQTARAKTNPLKIIIMSATLNAELFENYFNAKVVYVKGRQFPVRTFFTLVPEPNYLDATLITILQIHLSEKNNRGDILAFLTGQNEIESIEKLLLGRQQLIPDDCLRIMVCPLFGALTTQKQQRVFDSAPQGTRKIVLCTNIAETSVTVPDIKFVVDCGMVKCRVYNPRIGMDVLAIVPISKAQALQRSGRAGRTQQGDCYRIYTEQSHASLPATSVPEILRVNLATVILTLKTIGITNILDFNYIERPSVDSLKRALSELWLLGALDTEGNLSDIGQKMALFPLSPFLSKTLILSDSKNCSREVMAVIAMLSVPNVILPLAANQAGDDLDAIQAQQTISVFFSPYGDHIMLLKIFEAYIAEKNQKEWCRNHFIHYKGMTQVMAIYDQLGEYFRNLKWIIKSSAPKDYNPNFSYDAVRQCFAAGFFSQSAVLLPNGAYQSVLDQKQVFIHPSSSLFQKKKIECIIYNELIMTSKEYLHTVLRIEKEWLIELFPDINKAKFEQQKLKMS